MSSCSIKESVESFRNDFYKKVIGNAKGITVSKNENLIFIKPDPNTRIKTRAQAIKAGEQKLKALQALSSEYTGDPYAFGREGVMVSPEGEVFIPITPPFAMYREILLKKEAIEAANKALQEDTKQALEDGKAREKEINKEENFTQEEKELFTEESRAYTAEQVDLFNYQRLEMERTGLTPAEQNLVDTQSEQMPLFSKGTLLSPSNTPGTMLQDDLDATGRSFSDTLSSYFNTTRSMLYAEKKRILDELRNKTITDPLEKERANEHLSYIEIGIRKIENKIDVLKGQDFADYIVVLKKEIEELKEHFSTDNFQNAIDPVVLETNMTFNRIEILQELLDGFNTLQEDYSVGNISNDQYGNLKKLEGYLIPEVYGHLEGGKVFQEIIDGINGLTTTVKDKRADIMFQTLLQNPIVIANLNSETINEKGERVKILTEDQLRKFVENTTFKSYNKLVENVKNLVSSIGSRDSQAEEVALRAQQDTEANAEEQIEASYKDKFNVLFEDFKTALREKYKIGEGSKLRQKINSILLDQKSFGRRMVSIFTEEYDKSIKSFKHSLNTEINGSNTNSTSHAAVRQMMSDLDSEHDIIEIHRLPEVYDLLGEDLDDSVYSRYIESDSYKRDSYRQELVDRLGDREAERIINQAVQQVKEFAAEAKRVAINFTGEETAKFLQEYNPLLFSSNLEEWKQGYKNDPAYQGSAATYVEVNPIINNTSNPTFKTIYSTGKGFLTYIPKGNLETNPNHFSEQFKKSIVDQDPIYYDTWKAAYEYQNEYINTRLRQPFNTSTKIAQTYFQSFRDVLGERGFFHAMKFLYNGGTFNPRRWLIEVGRHYETRNFHVINQIGVKKEYAGYESKIKSRASMYKNTDIEILKNKIKSEDITVESFQKFMDKAIDTARTGEKPETTRTRALKMYKAHLAESLAAEEVLSRYEDDFQNNLLSTGSIAKEMRTKERILPMANALKYIMEDSVFTVGAQDNVSRDYAKKAFNDKIQSEIKNNAEKAGSSITVRNKSTGNVHRDAEIEKARREAAENIHSKTKKLYNKTEEEHLRFLKSMEAGEVADNYSFEIIDDEGYLEKYMVYLDKDGKRIYKKIIINKDKSLSGAEISLDSNYSEYQQAIGKYIIEQYKVLGGEISGKSVLAAISRRISTNVLTLKMVSGIHNAYEAIRSLRDNSLFEGDHVAEISAMADTFTEKFNQWRVFKNGLKTVSASKRKQFKIAEMVVEKLNTRQKKTNPVDEAQKVTKYANKERSELANKSIEELGFMPSIDLPEGKVQTQTALLEMGRTLIPTEYTNKKGETVMVPMFGRLLQYETNAAGKIIGIKLDSEGNPIYHENKYGINIYDIEGTDLKLLPGFRTKENIETWEDYGTSSFSKGKGNAVSALAYRITDRTNRTQGNYSDKDYSELVDSFIGSIVMKLSGWAGEQANRTFFSTTQTNVLTGAGPRDAIYKKNKQTLAAAILPHAVGILPAVGFAAGGAMLGGALAIPIILAFASKFAVNHVTNPGALAIATSLNDSFAKHGMTDIFLESMIQTTTRVMSPITRLMFVDKVQKFNKIKNFTDGLSPMLRTIEQNGIDAPYTESDRNRVKYLSQISAGAIKLKLGGLALGMFFKSGLLTEILSYLFPAFAPPPEDEEEDEELKGKTPEQIKRIQDERQARREALNIVMEQIGNAVLNNTDRAAYSRFLLANPFTYASNRIGSNVFWQSLVASFKGLTDIADPEGQPGDKVRGLSRASILMANFFPDVFAGIYQYVSTGARSSSFMGLSDVKIYSPDTFSKHADKIALDPDLYAKRQLGTRANENSIVGKLTKYLVDVHADKNDDRYDTLAIGITERNVRDIDKKNLDKFFKVFNKKRNESEVERLVRIKNWIENDTAIPVREPELYKEVVSALKSAYSRQEFKHHREQNWYKGMRKEIDDDFINRQNRYDLTKKMKATAEDAAIEGAPVEEAIAPTQMEIEIMKQKGLIEDVEAPELE